MTRSPARRRPGRDRADRGWVRLHAVLGCLLVFLSTSVSSVHAHDLTSHATDPFAATAAASDGTSDPLQGHTPADPIDCRICELNRRAEVGDGMANLPAIVDVRVTVPSETLPEPLSAPCAPERGRASPRAPPAFSV